MLRPCTLTSRRSFGAVFFARFVLTASCSAFPPKSDSVVAVLEKAAQHNPMFKQMDREEREMLFRAMFECKYKADDTIIREGDHGDNFYILTEGECEVFVSKTPGVPVSPSSSSDFVFGGCFFLSVRRSSVALTRARVCSPASCCATRPVTRSASWR